MSGLKEKAQQLEQECTNLKEKQHLHLKNIGDNDSKVRFYTRFSTLSALMACFSSLGPAVNTLNYWAGTSGTVATQAKSIKGRKRILPLLEEFFLVLVRLCLGLFEQA